MEFAYSRRLAVLTDWMKREKVDAAVIHDLEGRRTASLRYLCGMPGDAALIVFANGGNVLIPWDLHMARETARAEEMIPQSYFNRDVERGITETILNNGCGSGSTVEVSSATPYPVFRSLESKLPSCEVVSRYNGIDEFLLKERMIKDETEIAVYRNACAQTNAVIRGIEDNWASFDTEADIALFIEKTGRGLGAEGTGFETIAAGPDRSFGIHAFPSYTGAKLKDSGLTIIDFGLVFSGYTTDVTVTAASGKLSREQEKRLSLVEEAYALAAEAAAPGKNTKEMAAEVTDHFASGGYSMPHSLGHGIGLDAHEYPFIKDNIAEGTVLKPGMIITIEPGLYDPGAGGVRLENDFLITESGAERLTSSRIIRPE